MTEPSLKPPSYDKVIMDCGEPLVLRPPVGSAVYADSKYVPDPMFANQHPRRRRSGLVYVFAFLLILLAIAGVLMVLFLFGLGPLALAYKQDRFHQHHQSICRIRIPFLKIDPIESVTADENSLNVSISSLPTYNVVRILHSFEDRLTVIRTNEHCYIRPIRAELVSDSAMDYVKRLNEGSDLQESVNGRVFTEPWFVDQSAPSQIYSSLVMAWCTGVPVYRLVSQPPSGGYQLDNRAQEAEMGPSFHDSFESDDDEDALNLLNGVKLKFDKPRRVRSRRSVDIAQTMNLRPDQLPIVAMQQGSRQKCSIMADILEDAPIPSKHQPAHVRVIRDLIIKCNEK